MSIATFKYSDIVCGLHCTLVLGPENVMVGACCDNECDFMQCDDIAKFSLGHHSASLLVFDSAVKLPKTHEWQRDREFLEEMCAGVTVLASFWQVLKPRNYESIRLYVLCLSLSHT